MNILDWRILLNEADYKECEKCGGEEFSCAATYESTVRIGELSDKSTIFLTYPYRSVFLKINCENCGFSKKVVVGSKEVKK